MPSARLTNAIPSRLQLVEQCDQVFEIAPESIKTPADQHVEPAAPGVSDEIIERRPPILRSRHALIDVLDRRPVARLHVASNLLQLILRLLLESRDAGVYGGPHERASVRVVPALRI